MSARSVHARFAAILGTAAVATALVLVAPTAASAATTNYTLDCAGSPYSSQAFYVAPGDTITLELTGFDEFFDYISATSTAVNPAGETLVLAAGDDVDLHDTTATCLNTFNAFVLEAAPETVPSGSLLFSQSISITPPAAPQIVVTENDGGSGEHLLALQPECGLSTSISGDHVYGTLDVTVTTAGTYTFKGLYSTPLGYYTGLNPYDPIGDSFLALYSTFDPSNPDSGVVGCNDDLNDVGPSNDAEYRSDGSIIEGHHPYLTAALTPGQYTLVLMTWEDLSSSDLDAGYAPWEDSDFQLGTKSVAFELWGPAAGLVLGHVALAATGVDSTGLALGAIGGATVVGAGMLLLVIARRRRSTRA